jgi:hypothetical protein
MRDLWDVAAAFALEHPELVAAEGVSVEHVEREDRRPIFGNLPGWAAAEAEARRKYARQNLPDQAWAEARITGGWSTPPIVTPDFVYAVARTWFDHAQIPNQTDAERDAERAEEARLDRINEQQEAAKRAREDARPSVLDKYKK